MFKAITDYLHKIILGNTVAQPNVRKNYDQCPKKLKY